MSCDPTPVSPKTVPQANRPDAKGALPVKLPGVPTDVCGQDRQDEKVAPDAGWVLPEGISESTKEFLESGEGLNSAGLARAEDIRTVSLGSLQATVSRSVLALDNRLLRNGYTSEHENRLSEVNKAIFAEDADGAIVPVIARERSLSFLKALHFAEYGKPQGFALTEGTNEKKREALLNFALKVAQSEKPTLALANFVESYGYLVGARENGGTEHKIDRAKILAMRLFLREDCLERIGAHANEVTSICELGGAGDGADFKKTIVKQLNGRVYSIGNFADAVWYADEKYFSVERGRKQ